LGLVLLRTTGWCDVEINLDLENAVILTISWTFGSLYQVLEFREISNQWYHLDVNANISSRLTEPFVEEHPELKRLGWREVRHCFYHFIDTDESLAKKSQIVRANGLNWTTVADIRAISLIGIIILVCAAAFSQWQPVPWAKFDEYRIFAPMFVLLSLFVCSLPISDKLTKRHRYLGNEQCEYILLHKRNALRGMLIEAAANAR